MLYSSDEVHDVVDPRRQGVDVLAVEGSDEGRIEVSDDLVGQLVAPVLALADEGVHVLGLFELLAKLQVQLRAFDRVVRRLVEEVEEAGVLREQTDPHALSPVGRAQSTGALGSGKSSRAGTINRPTTRAR